jgi:hypothetical protein
VVEDLVRFVGYALLKLATIGGYESGEGGIFLEGTLGLFTIAGALFVVSRLLT